MRPISSKGMLQSMQKAIVEYSGALTLASTLLGASKRKSAHIVALFIIGKSVGNFMRNHQQIC